MIVVSFYAWREDKYNCDYDELLLLLDKSCKKLDFKHYVISDEPRPKPLNTFLLHLPKNLMEAMIYGQMKLLIEAREPVLFTGADCLLTRDPRPWFGGDISITTSDTFSDCKMNTGAIFVSNPWICAEKIWSPTLDLKPEVWGEDQIYLYQIIKQSGLAINEFSCEEHNWAPNDINDDAGLPTIVHFRGNRKSFMKEWANKHLGIR